MLVLLLALFFSRLHASSVTCNYFADVTDSSDIEYTPTDTCFGYYDISNYSSIYTCSSDGTYVTLMTYESFDCTTNSYTNTTIWANSTDYQFVCGQSDCQVTIKYAYYDSTDDCSGSVSTLTQEAYVAGVCNNASGFSYVYGCTSKGYTEYSYSDSVCSTSLLKISYNGGKCYGDSLITESDYYTIVNCAMPGYYGVASSQISAFSTFVSFVMIAIAFFVC